MADEPEVSTVEALARLSFVIGALLEAHAGAEDLSIQQVRLLGILRDREPTINELASHVGVDKSSMSGAVARAERRGLVSRVPDAKDGRSIRVRLEPAGRTLVDAASDRFDRDLHGILAALTDRQRAQLTSLTVRFLEAAADQAGAELLPAAPSESGMNRR